MPCYDGGPTKEEVEASKKAVAAKMKEEARIRKENAILKDLLCQATKTLVKNKLRHTMSLDLYNWYLEHKIEDQVRIEREKKQTENEKKKVRALSKLTKQEIQLLGIRP